MAATPINVELTETERTVLSVVYAKGECTRPDISASLDVSKPTVSLAVAALEEAGLVSRTVHGEVPVRVEYQLTCDGGRLLPVVEVMKTFGLWLKARRQGETIRAFDADGINIRIERR